MTDTKLQDFYTALGGNYALVLRRLKTDSMIRSFLVDFLEDEEFSKLNQAMAAGDDLAAFEAVHALKGVALNMEFGFFSESVVALTEALRHGHKPEADALYENVRKDYQRLVTLIKGVLEEA